MGRDDQWRQPVYRLRAVVDVVLPRGSAHPHDGRIYFGRRRPERPYGTLRCMPRRATTQEWEDGVLKGGRTHAFSKAMVDDAPHAGVVAAFYLWQPRCWMEPTEIRRDPGYGPYRSGSYEPGRDTGMDTIPAHVLQWAHRL